MNNNNIRRSQRFSLKIRKLVFEQLASRIMLAADIAAQFAQPFDGLQESKHDESLELGPALPNSLPLHIGNTSGAQVDIAPYTNLIAVAPMGPTLGAGIGAGIGAGTDNPGDPEDPGPAKECTLRAAIDQANRTAGYNTIAVGPHAVGFSVDPIIPALKAAGQADYSVNSEGNDGDLDSSDMICWTGNYVPRDLDVSTITPENDPLPDIIDPVSIQGAVEGQGRYPKTEIDGKSVTGSGFKILASGSAISGLAIHSFSQNGIEILSHNNLINSNFIGTDRTGSIALPNTIGVKISGMGTQLGAMIGDWPNADAYNQVVPLEGFNVISGNTSHGVEISGAMNVVSQNYIGTNRYGDSALGNGGNGVELKSDAGANFVGGGASGLSPRHGNAGVNVISGNAGEGVHIGDRNSGSWIDGILIGTDWSGRSPIPNGKNGVAVDASSGVNIRLNTISGNTQNGVVLKGSTNAIIRENMIGTNKLGNAALAIQKDGILLSDGASGAQIHENVISGNELNGVHITGEMSSRSWIWGNKIGVDKTAGAQIKNHEEGILIEGGSSEHIIGVDGLASATGGRNVISGNGKNGIHLDSGNGTRIQGNVIGTDGTRTVPLPNMNHGIFIDGIASEVLIGVDEITPSGQTGIPSKEQNFIAANKNDGIFIGASASKVVIAGNTIGLKVDSNNLGNGGNGITVAGDHNQIGTDGDNILDTREWNAIEANGKNGIELSRGDQNIVAGNLIVYNAGNGVALSAGASKNIIGYGGISPNYAATRNTISQNSGNGVFITDPFTSFNMVAGNYIGLDPSGSLESPNSLDGVLIQGKSKYNVIGTNGDTIGDNWERNFISGNTLSGVRIKETGTTTNSVAGNTIGLTVTETVKGNGESGVVIENAAENFVGISGAPGSGNEPNVISGNLQYGVWIRDAFSKSNTVAGNFIGTNKAGTLARPNLIGVKISDSASHNVVSKGNVISGNTNEGVVLEGSYSVYNQVLNNLIGTDSTGNADLGNLSYGVLIDGARHSVLGGNYISGNDRSGVRITNSAQENELTGNHIGVPKYKSIFWPDSSLGNGTPAVVGHGIFIDGFSRGNQIGRVGKGNIINGNFGNGVRITDSDDNSLIGNRIGIEDDTGFSFFPNKSHGIQITNGVKNSIGGIKALEGNTIAYNQGDGVWIESGFQNSILGNSIFENDELGIDLGMNGVTPNDVNDADAGANNLQNFPMLEKGSSATAIKGILISEKALVGETKKYRIEVFGSDVADPNRHGEGKVFVGAITVQWQNEGSAIFSLTPSASYPFYSATATEILETDKAGNHIFGSTSEFGPSDWTTKIDFLDKNSVKTTYANVSKWENAFSKLGVAGSAEVPGPPSSPEVEASPIADPNFYKTDSDRVYVRVEDTARRGFGTIQSNLNTIDLQNALADKVEQFDLIESPANSGIFLSEPFVFVSNKFDDTFMAAGMIDGDKKDPTLNVFNSQKSYSSPLDVLLGGNIKALYDKQTGTGPTPTSNSLGLIDSKIDIGKDIKEVTLTTHLISGSGATPAAVMRDFAAMNIAWAQGNIRIRPHDPTIPEEPQPTGVDLTNYLDAHLSENGIVLETEEQRSLKAGQSLSWSVIDYYVINDFTDKSIGAITSQSENVIITKKSSLGNFRASAHELGHALGNLGHTKAYTIEGRVNLMYSNWEATGSVNAAKRLTDDQINAARSHWAIKSPSTPNFAPSTLMNQPPASSKPGQLEPAMVAAIEILTQSGIHQDQRLLLISPRIEAKSLAEEDVQLESGTVQFEQTNWLTMGTSAIPAPGDSVTSRSKSMRAFSSQHILPDESKIAKSASTRNGVGLDGLALLDHFFQELGQD